MKAQKEINFSMVVILTILFYLVIGGSINYLPHKYYHLNSCNYYNTKPLQETIDFFDKKNLYIKQQMSNLAFVCENKKMTPFLLMYPLLPEEVINPYNVYITPSIVPGGKLEDTNDKLSKILGYPKFVFESKVVENTTRDLDRGDRSEINRKYNEFAIYWANIIEKELNVKIIEPKIVYIDPYEIHIFNFMFTFGFIILFLIYIRKKMYSNNNEK